MQIWSRWENFRPRGVRLSPLRITLIYLIFGTVALFISDVLFTLYLSEPLLSQVQALKGGVEIVLTGGLILALTSYREAHLHRERNRVEQHRQELNVLHRVLRHNIRNDINVILAHAELLQEHTPKEEVDDHCSTIVEKVEDLAEYTSQATLISHISGDANQGQTYELNGVVRHLLDRNRLISEETTVSTNIPSQTTIEAIPMFPELLDELVTNAIQHNDSSKPTVSIDVTEDKGQDMIEIRVSDNGPGIPAPEIEALRAMEENALNHLSGMGLWTVKRGIQNSGGQFFVEKPEEGGTAVVVRVPEASKSARHISLFPRFSDTHSEWVGD